MARHSCKAHNMCRAQVSLRAVPEQGCILVSHPLLRDSHSNYFYQTVVMLCRHSFASGTYGLILNRILSNEAKARVHDMIQGLDSSHGHAASSAGVDLALDMPLAMQTMLGQSLQSLTTTESHADPCVSCFLLTTSVCQPCHMLKTCCIAYA